MIEGQPFEGMRCDTHNEQIAAIMTGQQWIDDNTRERMREAADAHNREHGGGCTIRKIEGTT